jgi:hypothetical protein
MKLPLFVPTSGLELTSLSTDDPYVFGALNLDHASASSIADVASDSSFNDRLKMFYHESIACSARSPIEYSACYRDVPLYVAAGFDVSTDDCVNMDDAAKFKDYGQCGRLDETVDSHWWYVHRRSMIARQLTSFEKGLGWTYPAWKLFGDDDATSLGILDTPAKLKSLKHIAAAGILPSLLEDSPPAQLACLNPPLADFALGDDTVAPTAAPPPACDGGWYDVEEKKCAYWVPPPPTAAPTPCPSMPPATVCEVCAPAIVCPEPTAPVTPAAPALGAASMSMAPGLGGNNNLHAHSFLFGVMTTLVVGGIVMKLFTTMFKSGGRASNRSSYTVVPDHESLVV